MEFDGVSKKNSLNLKTLIGMPFSILLTKWNEEFYKTNKNDREDKKVGLLNAFSF